MLKGNESDAAGKSLKVYHVFMREIYLDKHTRKYANLYLCIKPLELVLSLKVYI